MTADEMKAMVQSTTSESAAATSADDTGKLSVIVDPGELAALNTLAQKTHDLRYEERDGKQPSKGPLTQPNPVKAIQRQMQDANVQGNTSPLTLSTGDFVTQCLPSEPQPHCSILETHTDSQGGWSRKLVVETQAEILHVQRQTDVKAPSSTSMTAGRSLSPSSISPESSAAPLHTDGVEKPSDVSVLLPPPSSALDNSPAAVELLDIDTAPLLFPLNSASGLPSLPSADEEKEVQQPWALPPPLPVLYNNFDLVEAEPTLDSSLVDWSPYCGAEALFSGLFVIKELTHSVFLPLKEGDMVDILEFAADNSSVVCRRQDGLIGLYQRLALATEDEIYAQVRGAEVLAKADGDIKDVLNAIDLNEEYANTKPVEKDLVVVGVPEIEEFLMLEEGSYVDVLEYLDSATVICRSESGAIGLFERKLLKTENEIYDEFKQQVESGDAGSAVKLIHRHSRTLSLVGSFLLPWCSLSLRAFCFHICSEWVARITHSSVILFCLCFINCYYFCTRSMQMAPCNC